MITQDNSLLRSYVETFADLIRTFSEEELRYSKERKEIWPEMSEWHAGRASAYQFCSKILTRYLQETE